MTCNRIVADRARKDRQFRALPRLDIGHLPVNGSFFRARLPIGLEANRSCSRHSPLGFTGILSFRCNLSVLEIDISWAPHLYGSHHVLFFPPRTHNVIYSNDCGVYIYIYIYICNHHVINSHLYSCSAAGCS